MRAGQESLSGRTAILLLSMSRQYLDVPYRSKDAAKALGARFDGAVKRWYVEADADLTAFTAWLPAGMSAPPCKSAIHCITACSVIRLDATATPCLARESGVAEPCALQYVAILGASQAAGTELDERNSPRRAGDFGDGRAGARVALNTVVDCTAAAARAAEQGIGHRLQRTGERAGGAVQSARDKAQALMREVTGQGPAKTLQRGFTIVRNDNGQPVTSRTQAEQRPTLHIQFRDGSTNVRTGPLEAKKPE